MGQVPDVIPRLMERFGRNREAYRGGRYNETQLRREFVDPLFEALGWDVQNKAGYAEAYKDVIHEDAIKVGGVTEAPDYCFRIGGTRKFFVEAKKPSVDIAHDVHPAYQLRRYAWSARLPLSILTDFEEFAVYDCRIRPKPSDKAAIARTMYITYEKYPEAWEHVASIFSKDAVLEGSFDKYVVSKRKRGTAEVDAEFLKEIEKWREALARNIALRNPKLSVREINFAVQRTIDRIIFLRMCEDRGVETYASLQGLINGTDVYGRLMQMFRTADDRYNSGLFHFNVERDRPQPPDELTPGLKIEDKVLKDIFRGLYYPDSPYEFSVLPADILGNVYEQFLGKVIHLTKGHHARVEEKPEVKKAGGVYYTPKYIVDYIVKHTVGKLLEGKTPRQVSRLRILDPACGSGSFLVGAYRFLLDWHRDWYLKDGAKKHTKQVYQGAGGQWYLTTAEKKRILLNTIYGVDIDPQAVEVTKLNLLLCVLENENQGTIGQLALIHQRALPDLAGNIKCGNSLIGPDFYDGKQLDLFDQEAKYRINAFDWPAEFPEIFKRRNPGFDAVIGNPPYVRVRAFKHAHPEEAKYLEGRYACAVHVWDIYLLFYERALELLRTGGRAGFIVPIQTLHQPNCESLRRLLFEQSSIRIVADLSALKVFAGPIVKNCIIVAEKGQPDSQPIIVTRPMSDGALTSGPVARWSPSEARTNPGLSLKTELLSPKKRLCDKLGERSYLLGDLFYVTFGLRSCAKGRGQGGKDRLVTTDPGGTKAKPYLEGRDISRYMTEWPKRYIRYVPEEMYSPRAPELFENPKIISQTMLSRMRLVATLDTQGFYVEQSLLCVIPHGLMTESKTGLPQYPLEFVLGVLNSTVASFYFGTYIIDYSLGGGLIHATPGSQAKIVIPQAPASRTQPVVRAVRQMLRLQNEVRAAATEHHKTVLQRQIAATDKEIDRLVYELYGLTEQEIAAVEKSTRA